MGLPKGRTNNPNGRPKGRKELKPRVRRGTVKTIYEEFLDEGDGKKNGHDLVKEAITKGVKEGGRLALGYVELGAKVLDSVDQDKGGVRIIFNGGLNPKALKVEKQASE